MTADKIAEVQRLSSALAARVRYAQMVQGPIVPEHIEALVAAAILITDHGLTWPPLVEQVLHDFAEASQGAAYRCPSDD